MPLDDRIGRALTVVLTQGALGTSLVLALSTAHATPVVPAAAASADGDSVAARLSAIRAGVSELSQSQSQAGTAEPRLDGPKLIPTWWGNGGWGRWHYGWGNHGFGWPNWHNWGNGWHNWGNGWNNWGNGWHNYWHNA